MAGASSSPKSRFEVLVDIPIGNNNAGHGLTRKNEATHHAASWPHKQADLQLTQSSQTTQTKLSQLDSILSPFCARTAIQAGEHHITQLARY